VTGCVLCEDASVGEKSDLKDCFVGHQKKIAPACKFRSKYQHRAIIAETLSCWFFRNVCHVLVFEMLPTNHVHYVVTVVATCPARCVIRTGLLNAANEQKLVISTCAVSILESYTVLPMAAALLVIVMWPIISIGYIPLQLMDVSLTAIKFLPHYGSSRHVLLLTEASLRWSSLSSQRCVDRCSSNSFFK